MLLDLGVSLALYFANEAALDDRDLLIERFLEVDIVTEVLAVTWVKRFGEV